MIAKIAVSAANFAIDKPYSYAVPENLCVQPGQRVMVPFGRSNRHTEGVVLSVEAGAESGLKNIASCLDAEPVLSERMLQLAAFMRQRYFCTLFDCLRVMLPAGLWFQQKETYALTQDRSWQEKSIRQADAALVLQLLENCGGNCEGKILRDAVASEEAFEKAVSYLLKKKWITAQRDFSRKTSDRTEQIATLAVSAEEAMEYASRRPKSAAMQRAVLELMCSVGEAAVKEICYFTGCKSTTVRKLAELGYLALWEKPVLRCREIVPTKLDGPLTLSQVQQMAFDGICKQMAGEKPGAALLYGVTGSGKTAVYIKLIQTVLVTICHTLNKLKTLRAIATLKSGNHYVHINTCLWYRLLKMA